MTNSLRNRTRRLLIQRSREVTYRVISDATGLKPAWLEAFAANRMPDPGVEKVERLFDYLNGKALKTILDECASSDL